MNYRRVETNHFMVIMVWCLICISFLWQNIALFSSISPSPKCSCAEDCFVCISLDHTCDGIVRDWAYFRNPVAMGSVDVWMLQSFPSLMNKWQMDNDSSHAMNPVTASRTLKWNQTSLCNKRGINNHKYVSMMKSKNQYVLMALAKFVQTDSKNATMNPR